VLRQTLVRRTASRVIVAIDGRSNQFPVDYGPTVSDRPIFLDESRLRWRLLRPVLVACAIGLLIIPVILTLSILNVEVLPELTPQQPVATLERPEGTRSAHMTSPDSAKEQRRAQSVTSFSDRRLSDQSKTSFSDRWHELQAMTSQIPVTPPGHAASMVTSFTE
jgi:hypothetical protein